jgi:hypothetical protein
MNEPVTLPNLEPAAAARYVYPMRVLYSLRVAVLVHFYRAMQAPVVVEKIDVIRRHVRCIRAARL